MLATVEAKIIAAIAALIIILSVFGWYSEHLITAGKASEAAAVLKQQEKDQQIAAAETAGWKSQLVDAKTARQKEIDDALDRQLVPVVDPVKPGSVQKWALAAPVSASPAAADRGASPAAGGAVCAGLVPGSPAEMRSFNEAQSADRLIADYRDLYDSWPSTKEKQK
jgi:hypothetical protein